MIYLNLLDWEPKSNRVSVLLGGSEVYFWNASNLGTSSTISDQETTSCLGRLAYSIRIAAVSLNGRRLHDQAHRSGYWN